MRPDDRIRRALDNLASEISILSVRTDYTAKFMEHSHGR
jgi:hypothetical protein